MATNFPGSADSFTNPTSGSSLSSPSHADQHTNVNDAVEAIETALLDGAPLHIDDANNRVGIGTNSPSVPLHVSSTGAEGVRIQKSNNDQQGSYIGFYDDNARLGYVGYAANDDLYLENEASAGNTFLSTGGTIRMKIDSAGRVTKPYQPAFAAYVSGSGDVSFTGDINFTNTEFNNGGHFNLSNDRFTAPVAGLYFFSWSSYTNTTTSAQRTGIRVNGSTYMQNGSSGYSHNNITAFISLSAGDYVTIGGMGSWSSHFYGSQAHNLWMGWLVS